MALPKNLQIHSERGYTAWCALLGSPHDTRILCQDTCSYAAVRSRRRVSRVREHHENALIARPCVCMRGCAEALAVALRQQDVLLDEGIAQVLEYHYHPK